MLEYIRNSAQSLGVKVAFGVIILVFVFWGVGNFNDRDYSNVVAVVNGQPIVAFEFERAYMEAEEYLLRANPGLTREQLEREHLGRQVLNALIQQTLLNQEAQRAGIRVTPMEMRLAVGQIEAFQDDRGKFDPEAYKRVLAARRMPVADYEKGLASELLRDKLYRLLTASAWVDPDEARHRFNFLREKRLIDYLFVPASEFAAKVHVTDEQIKKWYESHQAEFGLPARVNVEYIMVRPEALADPATINDASARAWYQANQGRFERPEQVRASHILVPLAQDADEAAVREAQKKLGDARNLLAAGKPFSEVADAVNPQGAAEKGGDLGWLKRGETVPEFEAVVFELAEGAISEPLRTPFGLHLVTVTDKRPAGVAPFEEVAEEAFQALAHEQGSDKLQDVLDSLIEDNILMKPLADSARRYNLQAEKTGLVDKAALMEKLRLDDEGAASLMAVPQGAPLDTALEAGDNYLIARVVEAVEPGVRPLAAVKDQIAESIKAEEALAMAVKEADSLLERLRREPLAQAREREPRLKTGQALERAGMVPGFLPNDALMRAIFDAPLNSWLPDALPVTETSGKTGALVVRVDKVEPPDEEEFKAIAQLLGNAASQQRKDGIYAIFMEKLLRDADIKITNQNLVDRKGA